MSYLLQRLLQLVPTLIGITLLTFMMLYFAAGDPVKAMLGPEASDEQIEEKRSELGLNRPLPVQYLRWLGVMRRPQKVDGQEKWIWSGLLQGDLGKSITTNRAVWDEIAQRLPASLELAVLAMALALVVSLVAGILSAVFAESLLDHVTRFLVLIFLAMPSFWLGLELIILLSRNLHLFPPADRSTQSIDLMLRHLALPALTLGLGTAAFLCRILRSSMIETLRADFLRTARAKGVGPWSVVLRHALRNALIPFVTVAGLSAGALLGSSIIVETVFNWPGVGRLLVESIKERNAPVTMGTVLVLALAFVLINLAVDMLYSVIDPRIRLGAKGGGRS